MNIRFMFLGLLISGFLGSVQAVEIVLIGADGSRKTVDTSVGGKLMVSYMFNPDDNVVYEFVTAGHDAALVTRGLWEQMVARMPAVRQGWLNDAQDGGYRIVALVNIYDKAGDGEYRLREVVDATNPVQRNRLMPGALAEVAGPARPVAEAPIMPVAPARVEKITLVGQNHVKRELRVDQANVWVRPGSFDRSNRVIYEFLSGADSRLIGQHEWQQAITDNNIRSRWVNHGADMLGRIITSVNEFEEHTPGEYRWHATINVNTRAERLHLVPNKFHDVRAPRVAARVPVAAPAVAPVIKPVVEPVAPVVTPIDQVSHLAEEPILEEHEMQALGADNVPQPETWRERAARRLDAALLGGYWRV